MYRGSSNRRRSASTTPRSAMRRRSGAINQGVTHNVKPPKATKGVRTPSRPRGQDIQTPKRSNEKVANEGRKTRSQCKAATTRYGSLSASVDYVIKNGQCQFIKKSSTRKTLDFSTPTRVVRKTPKLFSASKNFLSDPVTPPPTQKKFPSPVKFAITQKEPTEQEPADVGSLIDSLDIEECQGNEQVKQEDAYAIFVSDDEMSRICCQTGEDIQSRDESTLSLELRQEIHDGKEAMGTETPSLQLSPRKLDQNERTPLKERNDGSLNGPQPGNVFSVFTKDAKTGIEKSLTSDLESKKLSTVSHARRRKEILEQLIIDAGQKEIGAKFCKTCKFLFSAGNVEEETIHNKVHKEYEGVIDFPGWKKERVVHLETSGLKILRIKPGDPKSHWSKVWAVLEVVNRTLGITDDIRQIDTVEVFICVVDKSIVGCVFVESLSPFDVLQRSVLRSGSRVLEEVKGKNKQGLCGITRIWVRDDHRRKGIASRLLDAVRAQYHFPLRLKRDELAFTHPTDQGSSFVTKYLKTSEFLVYKPSSSK